MITRSEETICAPATALGGAIAVIRISGVRSMDICDKIFYPSDKEIILTDQKGFNVIFGEIRSGARSLMKFFFLYSGHLAPTPVKIPSRSHVMPLRT